MSTTRTVVVALAMLMATGVAAAQGAPVGWTPIADSWNSNYSIICTRAGDRGYVVDIQQHPGINDYNVAREISYKSDTGGRYTALHFSRGFTGGSYPEDVSLGTDVTCRISKQ